MIDVALRSAVDDTRPASTSGRTSRMKPVEWQPGLAIRFEARDAGALIGGQLGQAEHPVARRPVRGARVDQAGRRIGDERDGLARRCVGQAEERDVGRVQQPRALARDPCAARARRAAPRRRCGERGTRGCEGRSCLPDRRRRRASPWWVSAGGIDSIKHDGASCARRRTEHRQWRPMATKKPKGLGTRAGSAPRPSRRRRRRRHRPRPTASRAASRSTSCSPAATSRARAWTKARSTSSPKASRRRA